MAEIFGLHTEILRALSVAESSRVKAFKHGSSHFGLTARLLVHHDSGEKIEYFLKILPERLGILTCHGEFEALKAVQSACGHAPKPYYWGAYTDKDTEKGFLIVEFLRLARQSHQRTDPHSLATIMADLHEKSISPTGKFGFHIATCHTGNIQAIKFWTDSWCELFAAHFSHILSLAQKGLQWPEFDCIGQIVLNIVVPKLLLPLQRDGRTIKPSLVHGDCWDGNTAMTEDGRAVFFDVASFYGHNEYDLGDWRAPRHALSDPAYANAYKEIVSPSEPVEEWDDRNLLYSLTWNICNALFIPGSNQRQMVFEDMINLCKKICPGEPRGIPTWDI